MVTRYYIHYGDKTNVGGTVIQGSGVTASYDQGMAYEGDGVQCPHCKSTGQIVCDGPRWPMTGVDGRQAALNNDICLCKCNPAPRLVSSQIVLSMDTVGSPGPATSGGATPDSGSPHLPKDEQFLVRDPTSGQPLANAPYQIRTGGGDLINGTTDMNGRTERVQTDDRQSLTFHLMPGSSS